LTKSRGNIHTDFTWPGIALACFNAAPS